jgi:hypothetical protein
MQKNLAFLLTAVLLGGCAASCENEISQSVTSPSGAIKAVVFNRGCGATVGFNTQLSIFPANTALPDSGGNVLTIDAGVPLRVQWESDSALRISGVPDARIVKQETSAAGVRVVYSK